jgi:hypothetical protein
VQQSTPDRNGDGVSAIVCLEFVYDVLDVKIYGGLRNRKPIGNLAVAISVAD